MFKKAIRNIFKKAGYDIIKVNPAFNAENEDTENIRQFYKWLLPYNFETIIDVGANQGQFSVKMRKLFPNANIFAFEPIPGCYNELLQNFKGDEKFKAFNFGLGDEEGELSFYVNDYSASSSLLPLNSNLKEAFSYADNAKETKIQIKVLDKLQSEIKIKKPTLIKVDVQGFEDKVIAGGYNFFENCTAVIIELSYVPLYESQPLFHEIYSQLVALGFIYRGNIEQLHHPNTNQILQADGFFVRINA
jgi:FkbM family methyltransferase